MGNVICVWKEIGQTPFQLVQKIKSKKEYSDLKIGFAGRLDPMAEGVMLFLVDEENKKRKDYERLPKTYEFEVLIGISTDTYDVMGIPTLYPVEKTAKTPLIKTGKFIQKYPPFSYIKAKGKPLYWWARNNRLSEIEIPKKEVEIYNARYLGSKSILFEDLFKIVKTRVRKAEGDFRQEEIISKWEELFDKNTKRNFKVYRFEVECSSGTYIRSIANELGLSIGNGAIALSITRTQVGKYSSINCENKISST